MDTEVLRDLRESDIRVAVLHDADYIVAELLGKRLGHDDILPGQPSRLATLDVTCSCIRPQLVIWSGEATETARRGALGVPGGVSPY